MKHLIILLSLLTCLTVSANGKPNDLYVSISSIISVHGIDSSRSTKTTFTISGSKITYEETYTGDRAGTREPVHKELTLTAQEVSNVKWVINKKNLLRSRSATYPPSSVPYTYYEVTDEIRWQGKRSLITVAGPITSDEMKKSRSYEDTDALLQLVRAIVNKKLSP